MEELPVPGAVQLIKPVKVESDDGEIRTVLAMNKNSQNIHRFQLNLLEKNRDSANLGIDLKNLTLGPTIYLHFWRQKTRFPI